MNWTFTHIVGAVVPLLPLDQHYLSHHQRGDEDEHHLGVYGLVTPVLHMETLVLHPANNKPVRQQAGNAKTCTFCV